MTSFYNPDYQNHPYSRKGNSKKDNREYRIGDNPEVSIITAYYNTGEVFWETFYTVVNQSFTNFEWLIVNDGSVKEDALKILSEVEKLDTRIRVIQNPQNIGLGSTRNNGVKNAKGSLLFFIDSDDLIEHTFLEKCVLCLRFNPHFSFVGSHTVGFGAKNYLWKHGFVHPMNFFIANYAVNCFVCRRSVFQKIDYISVKGGMEDWDFWLNAASHGMWGYSIPELLFWYRERENRIEEWPNILDEGKARIFIEGFKEKYEHIIKEKVYELQLSSVIKELPFHNKGGREVAFKSDILFILDYDLEEMQLKLMKDYVRYFQKNGARVTIVIHTQMNFQYDGDFLGITDDVFILNHICSRPRYHHLIHNLVATRDIQRVIVFNASQGTLFAPYLKSSFQDLQFDLIILSVQKGVSPSDLINKSNLDSNCIDHIGTASIGIKFYLETIPALYTKTYLTPPVKIDQHTIPSYNWLVRKKRDYQLNPSTLVISFIGKITFSTKFYILHNVISRLLAKGIYDFQFVFFGCGEAVGDFRNYLFDKNIQDRVWLFHADTSNLKVRDIINMSDLYLDLNHASGFNEPIREALCSGTPIASIGNSLMKDMIDKNVGFQLDSEQDSNDMQYLIENAITILSTPANRMKYKKKVLDKSNALLQIGNSSLLKFFHLRKKSVNDQASNIHVELLTTNLLSLV